MPGLSLWIKHTNSASNHSEGTGSQESRKCGRSSAGCVGVVYTPKKNLTVPTHRQHTVRGRRNGPRFSGPHIPA